MEGIQLRNETDTFFNILTDCLFENLDTISLAFTTDEDTHDSVKTICNKLEKCQNLHSMTITVWENSYVGSLFELLTATDLPLFKTVKDLSMIIHNCVDGTDHLAAFIGKFEQLERLQATPL